MHAHMHPLRRKQKSRLTHGRRVAKGKMTKQKEINTKKIKKRRVRRSREYRKMEEMRGKGRDKFI